MVLFLYNRAVNIEELPDDDWIQDKEWDEVYKQEVESNGKISLVLQI